MPPPVTCAQPCAHVANACLCVVPAVLLQLEEMKKARGLSVDDGTAAPDRPLAEILAERKQAKQDAFDDQWKQMKTGVGAHARPCSVMGLPGLMCS